jgi:hypothetical protein
MSEQRKSNWQHPKTHYRERKETPGTDECDTSQHPHPYRTLPTKAVQIMADWARDVVLEAVHFLVEIGNPRHARLSGMHSIRSYDMSARVLTKGRGAADCRQHRQAARPTSQGMELSHNLHGRFSK